MEGRHSTAGGLIWLAAVSCWTASNCMTGLGLTRAFKAPMRHRRRRSSRPCRPPCGEPLVIRMPFHGERGRRSAEPRSEWI